MNFHRQLLSVLAILLIVSTCYGMPYVRERRLFRLLLLGAALAPRGIVQVPVPVLGNQQGLAPNLLQLNPGQLGLNLGQQLGQFGNGFQGFF